MKKGKITKAALAVLSVMTIGATGATFAACGDDHEHNFGAWTIVGNQPTMTTGGTAERYCSDNDGGKETQVLPNLSDSSFWTENLAAAVAPTHTTDGSKTFTSAYGNVTITVPKDADAHTYGDWTITEQPTMDKGGKAKHVCTADDKHPEEINIPALSDKNVWTENTASYEAPTHTKDGKRVFTSVYGTVTVVLPKDANAHSFGAWAFVDGQTPTLENGGKIARTCTNADAHAQPFTETETVPALSDSSFWTEQVKQSASHQTAGKSDFTNATYNVTVTDVAMPKIAHTFGKWTITTEPTVTAKGEAKRVCTEAGCAADTTATEKKELPVLTDTSFWTKGEPVEADYNHPASVTYTNETYGSVTIITAPKLVAPYDNKTYSSVHFSVSPNTGKVVIGESWNTALLKVGDDGIGYGTGYPYRGKVLFEYLEPETGLVKLSVYAGSDGDYEEEADVVYAYVDSATGILVMPVWGAWNECHVAIPTENDAIVTGKDFKANAVLGDFAINYALDDIDLNIFVTEDGAAFGVKFTDVENNALTVEDCFVGETNEACTFVKDKNGKVIKGYGYNADKGEWSIADGLEGVYAVDGGTVTVNGVGFIKTPDGNGTYKIVSNTADSKIVGVILDNVYYEYTLSGDGMSANGGACTKETPKVTFTINFNGYIPNEANDMELSMEVSKYVPQDLAVPTHDKMNFQGWFTNPECTEDARVELVDGAYAPAGDVTLYAGWAEKVSLNLTGLLPEDADKAKMYFGDGDVISEKLMYTKYQIDEATNRYFEGWYIVTSDGEVPLDEGAVISTADDGATLRANWVAIPAYVGSYNLYDAYSENNVATFQTKTIKIDITGAISGAVTANIEEYDPITKKLIYSVGASTYTFFFDAESGIMIADYNNFGKSNTFNPDEVRFGVNGVTTNSVLSTYGIKVDGNAYDARLVGYQSYVAFLYEGQLITGITVKDALGNDLTISEIKNSKTIVIRNSADEIIFARASVSASFSGGSATVALDEYAGTYVNADEQDDVILDGIGNIAYGEKLGTYEKTADNEFDVYFYEDGVKTEYYALTIDTAAKTFVMDKVMAKITFVSDFTAVQEMNCNVNIATELPVPEHEVQLFRGWFTDEELKTPVIFNEDGKFMPTENTTLYAKWLVNKTVTIVYNDGATDNAVVHVGAGETLKVESPAYKKHMFDGWFTDAGFTAGSEWVSEETVIADDVTLYAKWSEAAYVDVFKGVYISAGNIKSTVGTGSVFNVNSKKDIIELTGVGAKMLSGVLPFDGCTEAYNNYTFVVEPVIDRTENTIVLNVERTKSGVIANYTFHGVIDTVSGIIALNYKSGVTDFSGGIAFLIPSDCGLVSNTNISSWNGDTAVFDYTGADGNVHSVVLMAHKVYFDATVTDEEGEHIATQLICKSTYVDIKSREQQQLFIGGYNGSAMVEFDNYKGVYIDAALGSVKFDGVGNVIIDGNTGRYTEVSENNFTTTVNGVYYEIALNVTDKTCTVVAPKSDIKFVFANATLEFDGAAVTSNTALSHGVNVKFALPTPVPATGYQFLGWFKESTFENSIKECTLEKGAAEITFYAKIEAMPKWASKETAETVAFVDGKANISGETSSINQTYWAKLEITNADKYYFYAPDTPVRVGGSQNSANYARYALVKQDGTVVKGFVSFGSSSKFAIDLERGTYYVQVDLGGKVAGSTYNYDCYGSFSIDIILGVNDTAAKALSYNVGDTVSVTPQVREFINTVYSVTLDAGKEYTVSFSRPKDNNYTPLYIYSDTNLSKQVTKLSGWKTEMSGDFTVSATGTYYVTVSDDLSFSIVEKGSGETVANPFSGKTFKGSYNDWIEETSYDLILKFNSGDEFSGSFTCDGAFGSFSFVSGTLSGDTLTLKDANGKTLVLTVSDGNAKLKILSSSTSDFVIDYSNETLTLQQ